MTPWERLAFYAVTVGAVAFFLWARPFPRYLPIPSPLRYVILAYTALMRRLFPCVVPERLCRCRRGRDLCLECLAIDWFWTLFVVYVVAVGAYDLLIRGGGLSQWITSSGS